MKKQQLLFPLLLLFVFACSNPNPKSDPVKETPDNTMKKYPTTGSIERLGSAIDALIPKDAQLEILAEGFEWSEGPLWLEKQQKVIFSDIPPNKIYEWSEKGGKKLYLHPSGYTGEKARGGEPGSNGLILDLEGRLVMCQHGDRRMARMDAPLDKPESKFVTVVDKWEGKKFDSPNDAVYNKNGDLYFTDPPYGLEGYIDDPTKEMNQQGVYRYSKDGEIKMLTGDLTRPNGLAFSPDESKLYVANSDPEKAYWMVYDHASDGSISNGKIFYNATDQVPDHKGLPDGMKIDDAGNIWATGPGGVYIFSPSAELLGMIRTGQATSNCAFNTDKSVFYMTADMYLLRLRL